MSYDWDGANTWHKPQAGVNLDISVAKKKNGSLCYVSMLGQEIYEGTVANMDTLLGADNTVTGWVSTGIITTDFGKCYVFNVGTDLFLSVANAGSATNLAYFKLYKSTSGNGGDWTEYSTVQSYTPLPTSNDYYDSAEFDVVPGEVVVTSSGRWVIVGPNYYSEGGYIVARAGIYTSDDNGLTWTYRQQLLAGILFREYYWSTTPRRIAISGSGNLFCAYLDSYGSRQLKIYKSVDDGNTWTQVADINTINWLGIFPYSAAGGFNLIENGSGGFYLHCSDSSESDYVNAIIEFPTPDTDLNSYSLIKQFPNVLGELYWGFKGGMKKIGSNLVITGCDVVLGVENVYSTKVIPLYRNNLLP